jgi:proteasome activator subunit 4
MATDRLAQLVHSLEGPSNDYSRATSPGGDYRNGDGRNGSDLEKTHRSQEEREKNLNICIKHLYIAVASGDFAPGAVHWTREIRGWLGLKFDLPKETRVKLVKLYYELALAPGLDTLVAERFASMFMILTK